MNVVSSVFVKLLNCVVRTCRLTVGMTFNGVDLMFICLLCAVAFCVRAIENVLHIVLIFT